MSIEIAPNIVVKFFMLYFFVINITGIIIMKIDKRKSIKHQWRIPEARLFTISILGGSLGVLSGMYLFHHKTKHPKFAIGMPTILIVQSCLLVKLLLF